MHGGAGGVGHMAVQLAKVRFKAYVVTTAGPANQTFIKEVCHCSTTNVDIIHAVLASKQDAAVWTRCRHRLPCFLPLHALARSKQVSINRRHGDQNCRDCAKTGPPIAGAQETGSMTRSNYRGNIDTVILQR